MSEEVVTENIRARTHKGKKCKMGSSRHRSGIKGDMQIAPFLVMSSTENDFGVS